MQVEGERGHHRGQREQESVSGGLPERERESVSGGLSEREREEEQEFERGAATHPPRGVRWEYSALALRWMNTLDQ